MVHDAPKSQRPPVRVPLHFGSRIAPLSLITRPAQKATRTTRRVFRGVSRLGLRSFAPKNFIHNMPVNWYLAMSRTCYTNADRLQADACVAHGVQALLAADAVVSRTGGRMYCDVIEIPSLFDRVLPPKWHPVSARLVDLAAQNYLRECDGLFTVGWTLGEELSPFGLPTTVLPNYRNPEPHPEETTLRSDCGLAPEDRLIVAISTLASGVEDVLYALQQLPEQIHFAVVGKFIPESYDSKIQSLIAELQLEDRVHLLGMVPYKELVGRLCRADLGLIIRDSAIPNNRVSLPNRVFDYITSGVPICSPAIPDIARIIESHDLGVAMPDDSPDTWAESITTALANTDRHKANARTASKTLTWDSLGDQFYQALGSPERVTFFGFEDLLKNNRTRRMALTLADRGVHVTICSNGEKKNLLAHERVDHFFL